MAGDDRVSKTRKLGKLVTEPQRLDKLRGAPLGGLEALLDEQESAAIVKVRKKGYVPPGITPVSRIDPKIFTARLRPAEIRQLDSDPLVASVELADTVRAVKD